MRLNAIKTPHAAAMMSSPVWAASDINVGDVRLTENLRGNFRSRIAGGCGFDCAAQYARLTCNCASSAMTNVAMKIRIIMRPPFAQQLCSFLEVVRGLCEAIAAPTRIQLQESPARA